MAKAFQAKMHLAREQQRETAEPLDVIKSASDAEAASIAEAEGLELQPNLTKDGYQMSASAGRSRATGRLSSYRVAVQQQGGERRFT